MDHIKTIHSQKKATLNTKVLWGWQNKYIFVSEVKKVDIYQNVMQLITHYLANI